MLYLFRHLFQNCHFKITILKLLILNNYFKFLHLKLIHFKITISKIIIHLKMSIQTNHKTHKI